MVLLAGLACCNDCRSWGVLPSRAGDLPISILFYNLQQYTYIIVINAHLLQLIVINRGVTFVTYYRKNNRRRTGVQSGAAPEGGLPSIVVLFLRSLRCFRWERPFSRAATQTWMRKRVFARLLESGLDENKGDLLASLPGGLSTGRPNSRPGEWLWFVVNVS